MKPCLLCPPQQILHRASECTIPEKIKGASQPPTSESLPDPRSDPHHVSRGQAKVDEDGRDGEEVTCTVVFMHPTAELLQCNRRPLKLLSQGEQQQQHIGHEEDQELEDDRERPDGGAREQEIKRRR